MSRLKVCFIFLFLLLSSALLAQSVGGIPVAYYQVDLQLDNVNRLNETRIVFHSFHMLDKDKQWIEGSNPNYDNSLASLLIVTERKAYILKDGYEPRDLVTRRKKEYWSKQQKWEKETRLLKALLEVEKEKQHLLKQISKAHPEYRNLTHKQEIMMIQQDPVISRLNPRKELLQASLQNIMIEYGEKTTFYKEQAADLVKVENRINNRRKLLLQTMQAKLTRLEKEAEAIESTVEGDTTVQDGSDASNTTADTNSAGDNADGLSVQPAPFREAPFYPNRYDSQPDYLLIANPVLRTASLTRFDLPGTNWVQSNYGKFYKDVRNRHVQRFVNQYNDLVRQPEKYNAFVEVKQHILDLKKSATEQNATGTTAETKTTTDQGGAGDEGQARWYRQVEVRANDGTHYTAIDADGNGITETFLVHEPGGFNWGQADLANVVCIYNNQDPEIETFIKSLVQAAFEGDAEKLKELNQNKDKVIEDVKKYIDQEEKLNRKAIDE